MTQLPRVCVARVGHCSGLLGCGAVATGTTGLCTCCCEQAARLAEGRGVCARAREALLPRALVDLRRHEGVELGLATVHVLHGDGVAAAHEVVEAHALLGTKRLQAARAVGEQHSDPFRLEVCVHARGALHTDELGIRRIACTQHTVVIAAPQSRT